jgi:DNA polymerase-3 subunit alpha
MAGLVLAGAFDSFPEHRAQYYNLDEKGLSIIEKAIRYGNKYQESKNSAQVSLFGEASEVQFEELVIPDCEPWNVMEKLAREKEVIGFYISGHPLDDYRTEMDNFCNAELDILKNLQQLEGRELTFGGIVTDVQHRVSKNGKGWALFTLEDFKDSYEFKIFNEEYLKYRHFLVMNSFLYVKTRLSRAWRDGDVRIQFTHMQLLQDVMEKMSKKITVQIDISVLDEKKVTSLQKIAKKYKGEKNLNFLVYDLEEKVKITMPSRNTKVNICKELLEELSEEKLKFKLN